MLGSNVCSSVALEWLAHVQVSTGGRLISIFSK